MRSSLTLPSLSLARTLTLTFAYAYRLQLSEMAGNALFEFSSMVKLEWRHGDQRVGKLAFFCAPHLIICPDSQPLVMAPMWLTHALPVSRRRCPKRY